uniref:ECR1_N domain-containing protein n=1 Tax=Panagrellus redivivus TaxID=6233 RepID=A0A7E4UVU8_PANRE
MSLLFDLASVPRVSKRPQKARKKTCIPGDVLFKAAEGYRAGFGTYEERGSIIATLYGFVCVLEAKSSDTGNNDKTVEIQQTEEGKKYITPVVGTIATARVLSITPKFARCSIFCIEDCILPVEFCATLRKEDMRDAEYSKIVIYEYVKPGDIILARILGIGDSQTSYLLSIADDELGVTNALGDNGERLVPKDFTKVESASGYQELRKVAQIPNLNK